LTIRTTPETAGSTPSLEGARVRDAMHPGVPSTSVGASLAEVARTMAAHHVHCVVVFAVDEERAGLKGRSWGVISDLDLVSAARTGEVEGWRAGDAARTPKVLVAPDDTLAHASDLMQKHKATHLVVADRVSTEPIGVLSRLDLAHALS
jgi:CBS domain-containing protein